VFGGTIRKVDIVLGDDELSEADRQHINELNAKVARSEGGHDNCLYTIRICATPIAARPDGFGSRGDLDDAKAKHGVRLRIAKGTEGFPYLNRL
jgi:hypothetical protein